MRIKAILFVVALSLSACAGGVNKTTAGALGAGAAGAGLGAIIGSQTGHAGAGTAVGAAAGILGGALLGNQLDEQDRRSAAANSRLDEQDRRLEENRRLIEELRRRGADAWSSDRGVVINLPDVLFEFDRSDLTRDAHYTIEEIAEVINGVRDRQIAVEGHTDSIGSVTYNRDLSTRRARAVARGLESKGVPAGQMVVRGYGEGAPIATNNSEAGRARNRRVEVIIEN
ncbi:MAG: OmpA family protein [bacterium]|nr:OmpA family protein [bacterium]